MAKSKSRRIQNATFKVALIAVMAALLLGGKEALSFVPNVEVVTLFCALFGYVFGWLGLFAVWIFILIEPFLYGFAVWVIEYYIHWTAVVLVFWGLAKLGVRNPILLTLSALVLTAAFGVQTGMLDMLVYGGNLARFWQKFAAYYVNGARFYIVQLICNLVLFLVAFLPLEKVLRSLAVRYRVGTRIPEQPREPADLPLEEAVPEEPFHEDQSHTD